MMKAVPMCVGLVAIALFMAHEATGGGLREFAKKATKKESTTSSEPDPKPERRNSDAANSAFGSGTYPSSGGGDGFLSGFWTWLVAAPFQYRHDDPGASMSPDEDGWAGTHSIFPRHELGQATVPYVRADYHWQYIDSDTDANDVGIEVGYKLLAFHGRTTMYKDRSDGFEMDINQYYAILRYGGYRPDFLPGTFEAGIGLGASQLKTNDSFIGDESAVAYTLFLKYHPREWCGIEFRPAWYTWVEDRRVGDYDLSASLGGRFIQLRGGYRWLMLQGEMFNEGPYAGVSVSF